MKHAQEQQLCNDVARLHKKGLTVEAIAKKLGYHRATIIRCCNILNLRVVLRKEKYSARSRLYVTIREAHATFPDKSHSELSDYCNCKYSTVRKALTGGLH